MRASRFALATTLALAAAVVAADAAHAKCTRLAFSVNDYGKEGPARDAKNLLDKYIAKWTAENGIKSYRVGKKDVTCELFLDFGFFDEYTCKAAASVCWPDGTGPAKTTATSASEKREPRAKAPAGEPAKGEAGKAAKSNPVATGSVGPSGPAAEKKQ